MSSVSSENMNISYSSDSDISSNAEELQMLEKLRINENAVINNEKEMQNKIIQYEKKIQELQRELNSQGSTSDLTQNIVEHQIENKSSDSFASQSSKSENLEFLSNYPNVFDNKQVRYQPQKEDFQQLNNFNGRESNCYNNAFISGKNIVNNVEQTLSLNYNEKYNKRLHLINNIEQFVNTKFSEAENIMNSLLYPGFRSNTNINIDNCNVRELQEQNVQLKSQLKELKTSLNRYLNRHEAAKRKREDRENLLNQRIAFLEEREKNLAQIIEMQQKS